MLAPCVTTDSMTAGFRSIISFSCSRRRRLALLISVFVLKNLQQNNFLPCRQRIRIRIEINIKSKLITPKILPRIISKLLVARIDELRLIVVERFVFLSGTIEPGSQKSIGHSIDDVLHTSSNCWWLNDDNDWNSLFQVHWPKICNVEYFRETGNQQEEQLNRRFSNRNIRNPESGIKMHGSKSTRFVLDKSRCFNAFKYLNESWTTPEHQSKKNKCRMLFVCLSRKLQLFKEWLTSEIFISCHRQPC